MESRGSGLEAALTWQGTGRGVRAGVERTQTGAVEAGEEADSLACEKGLKILITAFSMGHGARP